MSKTILLIENDAAFARDLTEALEAAGFAVRLTGDGKEGLDLAREVAPAGIVLCVELPKMSGYSICQKVKKDEALRAIPLVLTSAEATAETFEQHRKLKARAEDYLLKPYTPAALLEKLAALVGLPEPRAEERAPGEEEVVSLEEELGLEALGGEPDQELPALDLGAIADAPLPEMPAPGPLDDDLKLLDDAFDGLSSPPAPAHEPAAAPPPDALDLALGGEQPVAVAEVDAAAASLPPEDEAPGRAALGGLADEADLALGALGADEAPAEASPQDALAALDALAGPEPEAAPAPEPSPVPAPEAAAFPAVTFEPEPEPAAPSIRGANVELLRAAGIALLDEPAPATASFPAPPTGPSLAAVPPLPPDPPPAVESAAASAELARLEADLADRRAAVAARDAELRDLSDRLDALTHRAVDAESAVAERDGEIAALKARAEALAAAAKRQETDLKAGREEARKAADQARAAADQTRAAEEKARQADAAARSAEEKTRGAEEKQRAAEAAAKAAEEKARAAEAAARGAEEKQRAAEAAAKSAEEKARAAEAAAKGADEKARAAEEKAAQAGERHRTAEGQVAAALADVATHKSAHAEAVRGLEAKAAELSVAAAAAAKLEAAEREADELKTELIVARGEVEGARSEVEKRSAELKKRIAELEAANAKNEERVVKAYLKIKGDEKVRDKTRKALSIALQLLEEGLPPEPAAKPPAPGAGATKLE